MPECMLVCITSFPDGRWKDLETVCDLLERAPVYVIKCNDPPTNLLKTINKFQALCFPDNHKEALVSNNESYWIWISNFE